MARRREAIKAMRSPLLVAALHLLILALALAPPTAAAARAAPPGAPASNNTTTKTTTNNNACASQCSAAVAACRKAKRENLPDARAIQAIASAYGCAALPALRSPQCKDLSQLLLDAFAYEKSGYNLDGVPRAEVVAFDADPAAPGGKTPCRACAGEQTVCESVGQICVPFCYNDRVPLDEARIVGGPGTKFNGREPEWPREATSKVIFNKLALMTKDDATREQGVEAAYAVLTGRKPGTRASVHYHTSMVVSCVLEGCNRITLASDADDGSGSSTLPGGDVAATFCAKDGVPACYLMPSWTRLLNECVGDTPVKMIDFFTIAPSESYFHALEPLGKMETRQGAGEAGGVEVTVTPAAPGGASG
jgi:hypothetical protein